MSTQNNNQNNIDIGSKIQESVLDALRTGDFSRLNVEITDSVREVLNGITDEEYLSFACDIATYHHERWDGSGYPKGLKGEEIPLSARIMSLADVFDALISERCYKKAIPMEEAFKIIEGKANNHFDPKLVEVFLNHKEDFIKASTSEISKQ